MRCVIKFATRFDLPQTVGLGSTFTVSLKKNETCETPDLCQTNSFRSNRVLETYNLRLIVKYSLDLIAALVATVVTSYILLHIA